MKFFYNKNPNLFSSKIRVVKKFNCKKCKITLLKNLEKIIGKNVYKNVP